MNVCNYKEINALFALYKGVQWSPLHQPSSHCILPQNSQNPQKPLAEISSHGWHRCAQNFSPPSLDNCRREVCQNSLILKKSQSPDFHKPGLCYV